MKPAGRQVGVILGRIQNKEKPKPEDASAKEAKSPEKANEIRRRDDPGTTAVTAGLHSSSPAYAQSKQQYE